MNALFFFLFSFLACSKSSAFISRLPIAAPCVSSLVKWSRRPGADVDYERFYFSYMLCPMTRALLPCVLCVCRCRSSLIYHTTSMLHSTLAHSQYTNAPTTTSYLATTSHHLPQIDTRNTKEPLEELT
jgi:hypothetical protein